MPARDLLTVLIAATALATGGGCASCGDEPEGDSASEGDERSTDEPDNDAERAAAIARKIDESPDDAEAILEEHDMTIEEFEQLMYDVAADPKLSEQYDEARGKDDDD